MQRHRERFADDIGYRAAVALAALKKRARRAGVLCDLDAEWVISRLAGGCELTGRPFDLAHHLRARRTAHTPSFDRINPGGPYSKANTRVVLLAVNLALNDWGLEAFLPVAEALLACQAKDKVA